MHKNKSAYFLSFILLASCFFSHLAHAGRPLIVEDAGINEKGHGHIETWYERGAGKNNTWYASPAFSPTEWLEVAGQFSRDNTEKQHSKALQAKILFTPSNENGCNFGMLAGAQQYQGEGHITPYAIGIATCNSSTYGSVHLNFGIKRVEEDADLPGWGIAYEKPIGPVTAHIELYGERYSKPLTQVGLRTNILPFLQLDGTIGRHYGDTIYSIGLKVQF